MRCSSRPRATWIAGDVTLLPLVRLADVDEEREARTTAGARARGGGDLLDLLLDLREQLSVARHYFPNYSVPGSLAAALAERAAIVAR